MYTFMINDATITMKDEGGMLPSLTALIDDLTELEMTLEQKHIKDHPIIYNYLINILK